MINQEAADMIGRRHHHRFAGFSLIEVMVAVLVLSTGLLALAALQSALTRNAADARARSQVAAFVDLIVERQRVVGSTFSNVGDNTWSTTEVNDVAAAAGVSNLTPSVSVTHYSGKSGVFTVCDSTCTASLGATDSQYKEVKVAVTWTDASGQSRRYDLTTIVSPRTVKDNRLAYDQATAGSSGSTAKPVVRTNVPSDAGIIPIAIGSNTETAATNPKPKFNSSGTVIRTSFEVLTYQTSASSAKQQKRVETAIVGCTCSGSGFSSTNPQFASAQWPAYWNGTRYVVYQPTNGAAATVGSGVGSSSTGAQDELCLECCRDHHDDSSAGQVKFDPARFAAGVAHTHYKRNGTSLDPAGSNEPYLEACRMIRVDGFWRTAADFNLDHFAFLATANNADGYNPGDTAKTNYRDFVLSYLGDRYVSGSAYNTPLASSALTSKESSFSINSPTEINIARTGGTKWLHTRGLYLDYLEQDAINAIAEAKSRSTCAGSSLTNCVLPLVPVTAVNVTELATYSTSASQDITVQNNDFSSSTLSSSGDQVPVRGRTTSGTGPTPNNTPAITSVITKSNSGLVAISPIDTSDNAAASDTTLSQDAQTFRIAGGTPPGGEGGAFYVTLSGYVFGASSTKWPKVAFSNSGQTDVGCNPANPAAGVANPYRCDATTLGVATTIKITEYNDAGPSTGTFTVGGVKCVNNNGVDLLCSFSYSGNGQQCKNWNVTAPTVNSNTGTEKAETTTLAPITINTDTYPSNNPLVVSFALTGYTRGGTDGDADGNRVVSSPSTSTYHCSLPNGTNKNCSHASLVWDDVCNP